MSVEQVESKAELSVQNIGGIDETSVTFRPGITVLSGRNATYRTSLLEAVMAALGSDDVSMKADAEQANVELTVNGETYTRTFERRQGTVQTGGEPYLSDPTVADLFTFLLESNELRQAVATDAEFRDLVMRPVDTDAIQAEIERLLEERRSVSEELEELDEMKGRLPSLETQRAQLREDIDETETQLQEIEAEIQSRDENLEQQKREQAELDAKLDQLSEKRSTLEDVRYRLETEQESLDSLQSEKRELDDAYESLSEAPVGETEEISARIEDLRARKQELDSELNELRSAIGFNEELLDGTGETLNRALDDGSEQDSLTDELLPEETVTCWTCGSQVTTDEIETTLEKLRTLSQETVGEINDIDEELEELQDRKQTLKEKQRRREELEQRRSEIVTQIESTEASIERLSDRRDALREDIQEIEQSVEAERSESYAEILDLHKEANELEYELGRLETNIQNVQEAIADIESRLEDEDQLKDRRETISDEIAELRTRIEQLEQRAIEEFNEHMSAVLDLLEYENINRIWLERKETTVREGRQKVQKTLFELHVVRQTESGTVYEDTVDNLSESEREVTGLIFALAGYLAHEVHETVPFVLLDSLEAIDSQRIAALVQYLEDYAEYLVVALLPEDASALPDGCHSITDI